MTDTSNEHVFLFGIEVESAEPVSRETAKRFAYGILEVGSEGAEENNQGMMPSWWHAEDDREDGSDRDSLTFTPYRPKSPTRMPVPTYGYVTGDWLIESTDLLGEDRPRAYWARIDGYAAGGLLCTVSRGVAEIMARDHQKLHEAEHAFDGVILQGNLMVVYRTEESGADPGIDEIRADLGGTFGLPGWTWSEIEVEDYDNYLLVG